MSGRSCIRYRGTPSLALVALVMHGAFSVHIVQVAAAGAIVHGPPQLSGDEASLQSPMVPRRRLVRQEAEDENTEMGPLGASRPSLIETLSANVPDGTVIPDQYKSDAFNFDPYSDGPTEVIGEKGAPGHEGIQGHKGNIGDTGNEGKSGPGGDDGKDGNTGKKGHMFHLHGYATRAEVMKCFLLNLTLSILAFTILMHKIRQKYGQAQNGVEFILTIVGLDFQKFAGRPDAWQSVEQTVKEAVSGQTSVSTSDVQVTLSDSPSDGAGGAIAAQVFVVKDTASEAAAMAEAVPKSSTNIMKSVTASLANMGLGDMQVPGSTVVCTNVSTPAVY